MESQSVSYGDENMKTSGETSGSQPEAFDVGEIQTNQVQDVDTDILEPVVFTQDFIRFELENKGFLNPDSKITFSVSATSSASDCFYPINLGVNSLIRSCRLTCGGKTIQEIEDWNYYFAYKSMFVESEDNKNREQYLTSRMISHDFEYNSTIAPDGTYNANDTEADAYGIDNGVEMKMATSSKELHQWSYMSNEPVFQIAVGDLFPYLRSKDLPLYALEEKVQIELTLSSATSGIRGCNSSGSTIATKDNNVFNINRDDVRLIADYMYLPQEQMESLRSTMANVTTNYVDYRLSKMSVTNTTAKNLIRNIGGAGKVVTKIFTGLSMTDDGEVLGNTNLVNLFTADSTDYNTGTGISGSLTANVKFNGNFLYPIDVENSAHHYYNVQRAEGVAPKISRAEYDFAQSFGVTDRKLVGHKQDANLNGLFFYQAYSMNRNERVNSRGIELYHNYQNMLAGSYILRTWLETGKQVIYANGICQVRDV